VLASVKANCPLTVVMDRKIVVEPQPIRHPDWCDAARCTATPAATMGEAHRSVPASLVSHDPYGVNVTASLHKPYAPWLTEVYVDLQVTGLADDFMPVQGSSLVPAHRAAQTGQALVDLAARGSADQQRDRRLPAPAAHGRSTMTRATHPVAGWRGPTRSYWN
jgi:hypothetical protein